MYQIEWAVVSKERSFDIFFHSDVRDSNPSVDILSGSFYLVEDRDCQTKEPSWKSHPRLDKFYQRNNRTILTLTKQVLM